MQIQSLSIVVPNKECINHCPFCVSRMLGTLGKSLSIYENLMDINHPHYDINVREYLKRLRYVADNGCQTIMLTGTSEPQQNKQFLATFALLHQQIGSPFTNIEMQTTGFGLDEDRDYLRFLRNFVGVNTIALSVNAMDDLTNCKLIGQVIHKGELHRTDRGMEVAKTDIPKLSLRKLSKLLLEYGFNIRVCLNLNDAFNGYTGTEICTWAHGELCAHQITLRKLYTSSYSTPQAKWIKKHAVNKKTLKSIENYLSYRDVIGKTPYGATIYKGWNSSIVYDKDCMGKNPESDTLKYLILRPNCHLYSQWDLPETLVF